MVERASFAREHAVECLGLSHGSRVAVEQEPLGAVGTVEPVSGGGMPSQNARAVNAAYERKIDFLFAPAEIRQSLTSQLTSP